MSPFFANRRPGWPSTVAVSLLAAVIYLALGALGLSLAIAPGYATPIFPAAGFAVAILLWSDNRAWPGIWLGSCVLNMGVAALHGDLTPGNTLIAAGAASGATVQALAARWLLVRAIPDGWRTLETEYDIIRCLALAGPLACLISASVGVTALYAAGVVSASEYLYSWWNWWSGDTLGVLVMLPLSLTCLYYTKSPWRGRLLTLALPMLITLGLVGGAFFAVAQWEREQQRAAIENQGEALAQLLQQRFIAHQEALSALRRWYEVTPDMTYRQFEYFTRITLKDNPDIFALSINPYVLQSERQKFEHEMAARTGTSDFQITERDAQRQLRRAGGRPAYVSVGFIAPLAGNRPAVGYDINSEPLRHDAIQRAQRSGAPAVTRPIQLVQEQQKRIGILLLAPAHRPEIAAESQARQERLQGFAVGVIKVDEMVRIATRTADIDGLFFDIHDSQAPADNSLLYRSGATVAATDDYYRWQKQLSMADHTWLLSVSPAPEFLQQHRHWTALAVGIGGLALAALLQILLLVTTGRTAIVQRTVREQTAELHAKSDALEDRNAQLNALFSLSPDGFVAFAPDGKIKFVNPAFQAMTGIAAVDIVNQGEAALDQALRQRCERPQAFAGIATYFGGELAPAAHQPLSLKIPHPAVVQMVGIHSASSSVSRILYLRDITREAEVDQMKSDFLSHAAHELRTPMSSILGFSELLLDDDYDAATRQDMLNTIHRQTLWLVDIINELLDLSRIEARRGKDLKIVDLDLNALVRATVADLGIDQERWPVHVDLPETAIHVMADTTKLRQAVANVVGNACKYSPDGGAIHIAIEHAPGKIGIAVSDHGIGMTAEQMARFGERFWRADTSGKTPGTGLGIAIVKEILKLLGGSLTLHSEKNVGSTVTLWLLTSEPA